MILSKFVHFEPVENGIYAVYNSLFMKVLFVNYSEKEKIIQLRVSQNEEKVLLANGIYCQSEEKDNSVFNIIKNNILNHSMKISIMYLNVSTFCNLACKYCFIDNNPLSINDRRIMSFETAKNALDKFKLEIQRNKESSIAQIILYGGEPLTNSDNFEKIINYARHIMPKTKITLITNGTLLSENKIKYLKDRNIIIGLSLDGPKEINDKNRVYKCVENSVYDDATQWIPFLNQCNVQYGLSSTVTEDLVINKQSAFDCYKQLNIHDIFFNLYHYSKFVNQETWKDFYNKMSDFVLDMSDDLKTININEGRTRDQINLVASEIFKFQSCGAVGLNQITIQPNGDVCICQGDSRSCKDVIGNINKNEILDMIKNPSVANWMKYYTVCRKKCIKCPALFVCGGGCPLQSEALFGSRDDIDKASCIFYKKFLKWYLKKYYEKIKGGEKYDSSKS